MQVKIYCTGASYCKNWMRTDRDTHAEAGKLGWITWKTIKGFEPKGSARCPHCQKNEYFQSPIVTIGDIRRALKGLPADTVISIDSQNEVFRGAARARNRRA